MRPELIDEAIHHLNEWLEGNLLTQRESLLSFFSLEHEATIEEKEKLKALMSQAMDIRLRTAKLESEGYDLENVVVIY